MQIAAYLLNFTRLHAPVFPDTGSEKMKCGRWQNAFHTVRVGSTVACIRIRIKPVLYNSKLKDVLHVTFFNFKKNKKIMKAL